MQLDPGLLAAIIADPMNDDIRLIAADWLDEHGECDRADFIRLQIEISRTPASVPDDWVMSDGRRLTLDKVNPAIIDLQARERELLTPHRRDVEFLDFMPLASSKWIGRPTAEYSRGFVSHTTCAAYDWVRHGDCIAASAPIDRVTLATMPDMAMGDTNDKLRLIGHKSKAWHRIPLSGRSRVGALEESTEVRLLKRYWPRIKFTLPRPEAIRVAVNIATGQRMAFIDQSSRGAVITLPAGYSWVGGNP